MHSVLSTPQGGLPHSEIPRSKPVTGSFGLIAGYHVLHRLSTPRHPPCALRPVIIPTRHRRIGTSLSQACSCLTVRAHFNFVEMRTRTSHLRVHDLPSWWIQTFKPRRPIPRGEGEVDRQIVSNHAVVKERLVTLYPRAGCHLIC